MIRGRSDTVYGGTQGDRAVKKAASWVLLALCALAVACLRQRLSGAEVAVLAQQAVQQATPCHVVLDVTIDTDLIVDKLVVELWEAPPGRLKLVVLQAQSVQFRRLAYATDGEQSILYSPHTEQVTVGAPELVRLPAVLEPIVAARRAWIAGGDVEQARVVSVGRDGGLVLYQIEMPSSRGEALRFWLDARDWLVRKVAYEDDYLGEGLIAVRDLKQSTTLPDAAFELNIPEGAAVVQQPGEGEQFATFREAQRAANYRLRRPAYLPAGTHMDHGYQMDQDIALVYGGPQAFTLLQGPTVRPAAALAGSEVLVGGRQAVLVRDVAGDRLALSWRDAELSFSLSGALSRAELVRIAESLE